MKKGFMSFFVLLASVGFVSSAGLSDILNAIDETTLILFAVFILSFTLLFFSLNRVFKKENTTTSGIISVVISFLIVYGLSKSGWNIQNSLYGIGISSEVLGIVIPLILAAGIIFLIIKLAKDSLLVVGGLFIILSFFVYAQLILIVIGIILIVVRFLIPKNAWNRSRKNGFSGGKQMSMN
jgi:hypothetical protein